MPAIADLLHQALKLHQGGQLRQAEVLYRQMLQIEPRNFDAVHLLGLIALQVGRNDLAVDYLQQAVVLNPTFPAVHNNLANVWIALGKLDEAIAGFQHAVGLKPDYAEGHYNLGNALKLKGRLDDAIRSYQESVRCKPDHAEAHFNLANALYEQGKLDEAIAGYRQAVRLRGNHAEAYNNLGNALREQGKFDESIANCQRAVQLKPDFAEAYNNLGNALKEKGRFDEAIASYQQAVRLKPGFAEAFSNLGNALEGEEKYDEAVASCRQAVQLKPDYAEAYNNLGNALQGQENFDEAIASYQQSVRLRPDFAVAHVNRAMPLLLQGNFVEGWPEFEWRWRSPDFLKSCFSRPKSALREWDGSPLAGRAILLHAEQGLGDTIQFGRYASLLQQRGASAVTLVCPASLQRLMRRCQGFSAVVAAEPFPPFDVEAHLLSLPLLLGTTSIEQIPANVPYLDCDPALVERWQARLAALDRRRSALRVGIVWQGNPDNKSDRRRSVALDQFAPLAEQAGVRLFSLQKGPGSEQLEKMPKLAINLGAELMDFADTGAVIRCLDLVISVDTAVAHLAGALGTPVWLALSRVPDYRWLLDREDSPWYPTMRLFRQAQRGQWDDVFVRMKQALEGFRGERERVHES